MNEGKFFHVVITGASSGIGAALAEAYAGQGVLLSLNGRNRERLEKTAESVRKRGAQVFAEVIDVTDEESLRKWLIRCDDYDPVDLVIANAGISAGTGGQGESERQSRAIFAANLTGVLNTIHPIIPRMVARGNGQIAIMSSLASFIGFAGAPAYCASKAAVRVYGEALRGYLASKGVKVNVICPGFVKTPMTDVNRFLMPFIMVPEKAASIIKNGLAKNSARIIFPWQMYFLIRIFGLLPSWFKDFLTGRLPGKSSF